MTVQIVYSHDKFITENSDEARRFFDTGRFGSQLKDGRISLSPFEALYLLEKSKAEILDGRNKKLKLEDVLKKARRGVPNFAVRYAVFSDLRTRGYIVKTALKFGADFRVYDKGVKPGEKHAKWIVFPSHEREAFTWQEWSAKNRVAHSTKKHLLIAIVDDEGDVSYWEARWLRP